MSRVMRHVGVLAALVLSAVLTHTAEAFREQQQQGYGGQQIILPQPTACSNKLSKLMLNQSDYIQYVHHFTHIPALTAFTMHYWVLFLDLRRSATVFHYAQQSSTANDHLTVQLEAVDLSGYGGHYWTMRVNDVLVSRVKAPRLTTGTWHHMVHSWRSTDGLWSVFMDGRILDTGYSRESVGKVIPAGGVAASGQHQNTLGDGMDRRQGLEGWFTLFHLSSTDLASPRTPSTTATVHSLTRRCAADLKTDVINWRTTPRKGYGGIMETPGREVCGDF